MTKKMTKRGIRWRRYEPKSDVTPSKKDCYYNRIRMILRFVITLLHLLFDVVFHVDDNFLLENMHISANMKPKICK